MNIKYLHHGNLKPLPAILAILLLLTACGQSQATSEQPQFEFNPQKGELEKSVNGYDVVLKWETSEGDQAACLIDMSLKGSESLVRYLIPFKTCTAENIADSLEGEKKLLSDSAPSWQREVLDQFIAELRQLE